MINKRTANKLIPEVLAKQIKKSNIDKMETNQLIVKDGALWDLVLPENVELYNSKIEL